MHLYWRIIEELKDMNETWIINDPSLLRSYNHWLKKNAEILTLLIREDDPAFLAPFMDCRTLH